MIRYVFLIMMSFAFNPYGFSQNIPNKKKIAVNNHEYYIYISGAKTRADIEYIEQNIRKKNAVTYFLANRFPARYFLLKSAEKISRQQLIDWLNNPLYQVIFFGEGMSGKEQAIETGKKLKNKANT